MSHQIRTWRHGRQNLRGEHGQALVEFALILPVLLLLIFGIIKMGIAATSWSDETHLASEAARFAAVNSCSACGAQTINTFILTEADTGDLKTNGKVAIMFADKNGKFPGDSGYAAPTAGDKNHCQGDPVRVKVSYTYTLLNLAILPKFTIPITATSTQRLEADWVGDSAGHKAVAPVADKYDATDASGLPDPTNPSPDTC
jgi:Flp pilus assembly protein TadG